MKKKEAKLINAMPVPELKIAEERALPKEKRIREGGNSHVSRPPTVKQKLAAREYLLTGNKEEASRRAGYAIHRGSGWRNVSCHKTKAYAEEIVEKAQKKYDVSLEWCLKKLHLTVERSMPDDLANFEFGDKYLNGNVAISGISEVAKLHGYHKPSRSVDLNITGDMGACKELEELVKKYEQEF